MKRRAFIEGQEDMYRSQSCRHTQTDAEFYMTSPSLPIWSLAPIMMNQLAAFVRLKHMARCELRLKGMRDQTICKGSGTAFLQTCICKDRGFLMKELILLNLPRDGCGSSSQHRPQAVPSAPLHSFDSNTTALCNQRGK